SIANRCDFHLEQELARAETQDMRADLDAKNKCGCANSDFEFACDWKRPGENYFLCCRRFRVVTDEPTVIFALVDSCFVRHANTSLSSPLECSRREVWQCNRAAVVSFTSRCQRLDCKPALGARGRVLSGPYRMRCRSRFFPPASTVGQQVYWGEQPRDQFRSQRILGLVEVLP